MFFVPQTEERQPTETFEEIEDEDGAELDELYELESEFYDDEESGENGAEPDEFERFIEMIV